MDWCEENPLKLNVGKKREEEKEEKNMALDFNRKRKPFTPVSIRWEDTDRVDSSKSMHLNSKVDWSNYKEHRKALVSHSTYAEQQ